MFFKSFVIFRAVMFGLVGFICSEAQPYVTLKDGAIWNSTMQNRPVTITIKANGDSINGCKLFRLEWSEATNKSRFQTEYWFQKGDSVFLSNLSIFGGKQSNAKPSLIMVNGIKPGDSWKYPIKQGMITDTFSFIAERLDTVEVNGKKIEAIKIVKKMRGAEMRRWYAVGIGIVKEFTALVPIAAARAQNSDAPSPMKPPINGEKDAAKVFRQSKKGL